ncbi:tetratricopeptide repeat protein [Candidatus Symbiobacter mobilis]|nr:tetratricopeptide repeat protein [Candidatus Symbiobacter mobilis]
MPNRSLLPKVFLRSLALSVSLCAGLCASSVVLADDYADASQLVRANKFAEAMVKVDKVLATKPNDPQMRFLKGVIQRNQGRHADAIATFTKLTEDFPELPEPYNNLAVLYAGQAQYDKARIALEMAIRTNPSYATAHENLGDVYARLASQAYNKALQLDSGNLVVPPKLALIREVFKPNLGNTRPAPEPAPVAVTASASAPTPSPIPAPTPALAPNRPMSASAPATLSVPTSVPALVPAAPKPVDVAAAPKAPTVATTPGAPAANPTQAVEQAVMAWAQAWSAKDINAYLASYAPDAVPTGKGPRSTWEQERRDRILGKKSIHVQISKLQVKVQGDTAQAHFRQAYRGDDLSVSSSKTLGLRKVGAQWLIVSETSGR